MRGRNQGIGINWKGRLVNFALFPALSGHWCKLKDTLKLTECYIFFFFAKFVKPLVNFFLVIHLIISFYRTLILKKTIDLNVLSLYKLQNHLKLKIKKKNKTKKKQQTNKKNPTTLCSALLFLSRKKRKKEKKKHNNNNNKKTNKQKTNCNLNMTSSH